MCTGQDRPILKARYHDQAMSSHPQEESDLGSEPPPRVTVLCRSFPPAYLRGGPARSLAGLVGVFGTEYRLSVITSAFDDPKQGPMAGVQPDQWTEFSGARVWYESRRRPNLLRMRVLVRDSKPDLIYLNSLFDLRFSIVPLLNARLSSRRVPVLLAPRGELAAGALALKRRKKQFFLTCWRLLRLHTFVGWHASNELETQDIRRVFGQGQALGVFEAMNVHKPAGPGPRSGVSLTRTETLETLNHHLVPSFVFFSRIVAKKNLVGLLRALPEVRGKFTLTIAGPQEDASYWTKCSRLMDRLPPGMRPKYYGTVPADDVVSFLSRFDLFVLPTFGENFGHVVLEAMEAGIPVIVGQDTPWQIIEDRGAGWLCDPNDPRRLAAMLQRFIDLSDDQRETMGAAASRLATEILADPTHVQANRTMFTAMLSRDCSPA